MQYGARILTSRQENKRGIAVYEGHHPQADINMLYVKIVDGGSGLN